MSELRKDPLTNRWVIISQERSARPSDDMHDEKLSEHSFCPFCEGNESKTPTEIMAVRDSSSTNNEKGWRVRVIPNKYPVMESAIDLKRYGIGMYDAMSGTGAHEVVVEHPAHITNMADFDLPQIHEIFKVYKARIIDLYKDLRFRFILVFKNYGSSAGASLSHAHSQIIALPIVPWNIKVELEAARAHYQRKERCIYCDVIKQELMMRDRLVAENDRFVSFTPFASGFPFEIAIYPKYHSYRFTDTSEDDLLALSQIMKSVLTRLKIALNDPSYNIILQSAPNIVNRPGNLDYWSSIEYDYHWHIMITPRLTKVAGFEWGTGFYINPTPPEEAAAFLREFDRQE